MGFKLQKLKTLGLGPTVDLHVTEVPVEYQAVQNLLPSLWHQYHPQVQLLGTLHSLSMFSNRFNLVGGHGRFQNLAQKSNRNTPCMGCHLSVGHHAHTRTPGQFTVTTTVISLFWEKKPTQRRREHTNLNTDSKPSSGSSNVIQKHIILIDINHFKMLKFFLCAFFLSQLCCMCFYTLSNTIYLKSKVYIYYI